MNRPLLRLAAALLALLMLFGLAACQSGSDNDVDIHAVTDEMRSAAAWPDMLEIRKGDSREQKGFAAASARPVKKRGKLRPSPLYIVHACGV